MKISKNTFAAAALCLGLPLWSTAANAQASGSLSGTLNAQIVLQAGCTITGAPNAGTSGINLGTLNFGTQPAPSSAHGLRTPPAARGVRVPLR